MSSQVDGLLVVDKPIGVTSHDVVDIVRKRFGIKKVGHAGTLDPAASGVLILGVGQATRLLPFLVGHEKTYRATIRLGVRTLSDDAEGAVLETCDTSATADVDIRAAMSAMVGTHLQEPPAVSAKHVNGERAYQVVLRGESPKLSPREVTIKSFDLHTINRVSQTDEQFIDLDTTCEVSSGTYIRAMARDLGHALGVGGHVVELRRTQSGPWAESLALSLEDINSEKVLPMAAIATGLFACKTLSTDETEDISHGRPINAGGALETNNASTSGSNSHLVALLSPVGELMAISELSGETLRPTTVFTARASAAN